MKLGIDLVDILLDACLLYTSPFSRPDGQPCRKFLSQLTQHPLTGVDRLLVLFPQAGLLPLKLADFRQPDGTQLRGQAAISSAEHASV